MSENKQGNKISGKKATVDAYIKLHQFLMFDDNYRKMSSNAKILYSFLRSKVPYFEYITITAEEAIAEAEANGESIQGTKSYRDEDGYIYCVADNTELCYLLNVSESTLIRIKKELHKFGLLLEVKIKDKSNRLYPLEPAEEDLQEKWQYVQEIKKLREQKKEENAVKAKKYADKKRKNGNLQNESHGNLQNESHGNLQNESKIEFNLSNSRLKSFQIESKYLSIFKKVENTNLYDTTKIVIGKNIDRLTDKKLNIIVELFDIYKSEIKEVALNAVISRVLKSKVQSSFRGLLEKSLKTEIKGQVNESTEGNVPARKEKLPEWMEKRDQEEKTSLDRMNESKLEEFKKHVLNVAKNMNMTVDVTAITLENYHVASTYLDMGFGWDALSEIFTFLHQRKKIKSH